jgi:hypothetical protein
MGVNGVKGTHPNIEWTLVKAVLPSSYWGWAARLRQAQRLPSSESLAGEVCLQHEGFES